MIQNLKRRINLRIISDYKKIDGWLSDTEALGLYSIAKKLPSRAVVVEIGSWQGKSTYCISKGLKSGNVYAIDPFNRDAGKDIVSQIDYNKKTFENSLEYGFTKNMIDFNVIEKIIIKKGYSYQFHKEFKQIDFLFIDGDHSIEGCKLDYELFANKIKTGGFIAFHDYCPDRSDLGPTFVINDIILKSNIFSFYRRFDSLWVAKKN